MVKDTLKRLADERDTTITKLIIEMVKETGSINQAARRLGVANNALYYQIKRNNLRTVRTQERTELVESDSS